MRKFVTYIRVSTKRQGESGLGLEAQERDIQVFFDNYAEQPFEVIAAFCDIDSGTKADRVELTQAIELAKSEKATLMVAKLDRLSRSVAFIATLMEDKRLDLCVASLPSADKAMLHLYAVMAEMERDFISKRTQAALQAAKARGVKLGGARPKAEVRHAAVKAEADRQAERVGDTIRVSREAGQSYRQIANQLNTMSVPTARGGRWHAAQVQRYYGRLSGAAE
ncbi:MAG: recombinase family protein [Rhodobacteraceae bacterium]|nr:recombinase family protein [Paracoccaceae bacterium]